MSRQIFKILVSHPDVPRPVLELLRQKNFETIVCENVPPCKKEILKKISGVHGLLWAHTQPLNGEILDAAGSTLKCAAIISSGIDFVNLEDFKQRKIPLGHTPGVAKNAVADLAIGLMISAARSFHAGRLKIEESKWERQHINWLMGQEIRDSTVGFFGFGGIGQNIAKRLQNWQVAKFIYNTRTPKCDAEKELHAEHVSMDHLLKESDFLIISASLTSETACIFNSEAFGKMKKNCVLVNVGRGGIVDQTALYNALVSGQIFAAGIDVMTPEPLPSDDPLLTLPNCVITPHLGSKTMKTTTEMVTVAAMNIINVLEGKPMISPAY